MSMAIESKNIKKQEKEKKKKRQMQINQSENHTPLCVHDLVLKTVYFSEWLKKMEGFIYQILPEKEMQRKKGIAVNWKEIIVNVKESI